MRLERSCSSAAGICNQHGSLHFHKALSVQITADGADDSGTFYKSILNILIHDQVDITLTITLVGIGQTVELLRKYLQALGQQLHFGSMYRNFTGFGFEYFTLYTDDIAYVIFFKICIGLFPDVVAGYIYLNASL